MQLSVWWKNLLTNYRVVISFLLNITIFLVTSCASIPKPDVISVSVPGYSADVGVHKAHGKPRNVIVISLHGKEKGRLHSQNLAFAEGLAKSGYNVYTPQMPWYDYSADVGTAFVFLDALVHKVAADNQIIVVAGHSQGAPYALFYANAYNAPAQVVGTILLAPGHLVHLSRRIQEHTVDSVLLARKLVNSGKGNEKHIFADFNAGGGQGKKETTTTANIYLSYFDPGTSLNFLEVIRQLKRPILWVDGDQDKVAFRLDYSELYKYAPDLLMNRYTTVSGGHVDMWENAVTPAIEWLAQLTKTIQN